MKKLINSTLLTLMVLVPVLTYAAPAEPNALLTWANDNVILLLGMVVFIGALWSIFSATSSMLEHERREILAAQGIDVKEKEIKGTFLDGLWDRLSGLKPIERESDIQLDHDYDGIHELDNKLPPWWLYLFYFTIAWAIGYMYIYQFSDIGDSQAEEYAAAMAVAKEQKMDYLFKMANSVNENNVTQLMDEASLAEGQALFIRTCAACHGASGEGGVGPNMTDHYYIHGGSISEIFSTIKYGVPEKGMISWASQINPSAMQKVASYIMTLPATDPPNQKKAEGTLYVPEEN